MVRLERGEVSADGWVQVAVTVMCSVLVDPVRRTCTYARVWVADSSVLSPVTHSDVCRLHRLRQVRPRW